MEEEKKRRLVIRSFHVDEVRCGEENVLSRDGRMVVSADSFAGRADGEKLADVRIRVIDAARYGEWTNSIMDVIPVSAKVLGELGEGITHTLTGVYVLLTGVDTKGVQTAEFGSSEGIIEEQIAWGRAGTPARGDVLVMFDVTFCEGKGQDRAAVTQAHFLCDEFVQIFREQLKKLKGEDCSERHEYYDVVRRGKKKVVIVKQVAGQGAMYDMHLFGREPSGMAGGRSVIDFGNMPVVVTPNEYRDGILRSMQ